MTFNKLVRDKIPDIIKSEGRECRCSILSDDDYYKELKRKLIEEVNEFIESDDIEELADLEEVLRAILDVKKISYDDFEKVRNAKVNKIGAFSKKIYLKE